MHRLLPFALAALMLTPTPCRADDIAPYDARVGLFLHGQTTESGGPGVHGQALFRLYYFALGAHAGGNFWLAQQSGSGAVDLGFALRTRHFRAELLGYAGGGRHAHIGREHLLGDDPGASVSLPFAGGAINLFYVRALRARSSLLIGFSTMVERDLRERQVEYSYSYCHWGWASEECGGDTRSFHAGWMRLAIGGLVGVQFDLGAAHGRG